MRYLNLATLIAALWWSTILVTWAEISDPHSAGTSLSLTGSELSQTLTLMPAIVILVALIARYRKVPNQIMFFAAAIGIWASYLAFTLNAAATPAAVAGLEALTGVVGVVGSQSLTLGPLSYGLLALLIAGLSILAAMSTPTKTRISDPMSNDEPSDPRSLWDSQS